MHQMGASIRESCWSSFCKENNLQISVVFTLHILFSSKKIIVGRFFNSVKNFYLLDWVYWKCQEHRILIFERYGWWQKIKSRKYGTCVYLFLSCFWIYYCHLFASKQWYIVKVITSPSNSKNLPPLTNYLGYKRLNKRNVVLMFSYIWLVLEGFLHFWCENYC